MSSYVSCGMLGCTHIVIMVHFSMNNDVSDWNQILLTHLSHVAAHNNGECFFLNFCSAQSAQN